MEMLKVEHDGATFKVRPEDKDRFLAIHPAAKVAEPEADDKAEEVKDEPTPAEADNAPDAGAEAPQRAAEEKAVAPVEAEDKAVTMSSPDFRPRRSVR